MTAANVRRLPILDLLRAAAALSVFVSHWGVWLPPKSSNLLEEIVFHLFGSLLWAGGKGLHPGVVIFIVLSGFCIHLPLARRTAEQPSGRYWRFFILRRGVRILPVFWAATLLGCATILMVRAGYAVPAGTEDLAGPLPGGWSLAAILLMLGEVLPDLVPPGNDVLLTVVSEWWLYVLYPVFFTIRLRFGWRAIYPLVLILFFAGLALSVAGFGRVWFWNSLLHFYVYWALGAHAAELMYQPAQRRTRFLFGLAVFALYAGIGNLLLNVPGAHFLYTILLGLAAAALMSSIDPLSVARGRLWNGLATASEMSYSLYAIHVPALAAISAFGLAQGLLDASWFRSATFAAVLLAATLFHLLVERPSHRLARSLRD